MAIQLKQGTYFGQDLKSYETDFLKLSITLYQPNLCTARHHHENNYLSILTKGKYLEHHKDETDLITTGSILFRPDDYVHDNIFEEEGGTCFNIEFKKDWQNRSDSKFTLPNKFTNYRAGSFPSLYLLLLRFKNSESADLAWEFITEWLFQINAIQNSGKLKHHVQKAIQIIEEEMECFHSIELLAKRTFVHPVYLASAFKKATGLTIGNYQLKLKLKNAFPVLLNTSLSISDLTHRYGFYDDPHFIRSFKSLYGISPHQFRLSMKS